MLNIVCVKHGKKYGPEYVNILFDMVRRNLIEGTEGKFICFTDDPSGLSLGIEAWSLPAYVSGWWSKLYLFQPDLFPRGDRIVYFDLDLIITGRLDDLVRYDGDFAILKEFGNCDGWQSSIMLWRAGYGRQVWEQWLSEGKPDLPGGDQEWIERVLVTADILQDLYPKAFFSYKVDIPHKTPPRGSKVIVFHGEPKPDNCGDEWAANIWKIGGGTAAELELVCNANDDLLKHNIGSACKLDLPWLEPKPAHEGHAVICGGGPSLKANLDEIRWRKSIGQTIFATNNTFKFLRDNGIEPDAQVMLDARYENATFLPSTSQATHYFASQCHPEVFRRAEYFPNVVLWHSNNEILEQALIAPDGTEVLRINGGTTVGLSSMAIAYALGYRQMHLYGMDSSVTEEGHHAYQQSINDADRILDVACHGRTFKAAAWMVAQSDQFQQLAWDLANLDCVVTVHGEGLLPWLARNLAISLQEVPGITEINGLWWPAGDRIARTYVIGSLPDLDQMIAKCPQKRVAILAGGNVGVWPKHAAKHFEQVFTFEPDPTNYECLCKNVTEPNIQYANAALGETAGTVGMAQDFTNCGAHRVFGNGTTAMVTIDGLNLENVDLIQLDVEGYEFFALKGAEKTIDQCKPLIVLEMKAHGNFYGVAEAEIVQWLKERGYQRLFRAGRDVIFTNEEGAETCKHITGISPTKTESQQGSPLDSSGIHV